MRTTRRRNKDEQIAYYRAKFSLNDLVFDQYDPARYVGTLIEIHATTGIVRWHSHYSNTLALAQLTHAPLNAQEGDRLV